MELQKGRPKYTAGRLEKEIRTYDLLDKLGVAGNDLQKSFFVQSSGNQVLFINDSRYKGIPHKGFVRPN